MSVCLERLVHARCFHLKSVSPHRVDFVCLPPSPSQFPTNMLGDYVGSFHSLVIQFLLPQGSTPNCNIYISTFGPWKCPFCRMKVRMKRRRKPPRFHICVTTLLPSIPDASYKFLDDLRIWDNFIFVLNSFFFLFLFKIFFSNVVWN